MYVQLVKRISLGALTLLIAVSTQAQQIKRLTLPEAIEIGMASSKQLKVAQARADISKTKYQQQLASSMPNATITSQYQHLSTNIDEIKFQTGPSSYGTIGVSIHDQLLNTASITQVIFAGLRGWNMLQSTKDMMSAAQYDTEREKAELKNTIITAFYNAYKLKESRRVVQENMKVLEQRLKDVKNMQSVGMALQNDVLKVELSISNLEQTAAEVQSAIEVSNFNMVTLLGLPDGTRIDIVEDGSITTKPNFDMMAGLKNATSLRPELRAGDMRINASKRMLKVARGQYSPVLSAGFNYYYSRPNQRVFLENQIRFHDSWDIGVRLSWNITNLFTTQYHTKEAKLNLQQAETSQQQLNDNIRMEVNSNYAAYKLALDKIQLNEKAVAQAAENRSLTKNQYENGVKNITDMLDADNLVTASQINLVNAKIDAEIAYAKLLKATAN
jgi:outer membrane protein TolC